MKVEDVMRREVLSIEKDAAVSEAFDEMVRKDVGRLLITSKGKPVGTLTFRDLMDRLGSSRLERMPPSAIHVTSVYNEGVVTVKKDVELRRAFEIMLKEKVSSLYVEENGEIIGVITKADMLRVCKEKKVKVEEAFRRDKVSASPASRLVYIRDLMFQKELKAIPILENTRIVGLVTERAIAKAFYAIRKLVDARRMKERVRRLVAEDVMIQDPPIVKASDPLCKAAEIMASTNLPLLPVVDDRGKYVGIITREDVLAKCL